VCATVTFSLLDYQLWHGVGQGHRFSEEREPRCRSGDTASTRHGAPNLTREGGWRMVCAMR